VRCPNAPQTPANLKGDAAKINSCVLLG